MSDMNLTLRISYDGGQAKAQIVGLKGEVAQLSEQSQQMSAAQADASRRAAAYDALNIRSKQDVQREISKVNAAYNRLAATGSLSEEELARASAAAKAKVKSLKDELDAANLSASSGEKIISGYTKQMILFGTAFGALSEAKATVTNFAQFQQSIADLSAITGATGKQLAYLSDQAREMGSTTVYTASEAADAFKLVASAKPDLLSNSQALAEVTHQTLLLAEAAGTQLPDAANTLGSALNQFQAGASQAARFINVLAAGAKYGASEIPDVSEALKISGTVAHQVGLSFEETNAALQVMSQVALKGSLAGTGLRGVLLHLERQTNSQFKPSVVGLTQAFENLRAANLTTAQAQHMFGTQNVTAGQALIQGADKLGIMTERLTGTTIALDQAHIRTNTLEGDVKALTSAWQEQQLKLGDDVTPALRDLVQGTTHLIQDTKEFTNVVDVLGVALLALGTKALIARTGLATMTLSMDTVRASATALKSALAPLIIAEGALAWYKTGKAIWDAWGASQEKAAAKTQSSAEAMRLFGKYLLPATQRLEKLGVDMKDLDPRNIDQVREALHKLNESAHQAQEHSSQAINSLLSSWMAPAGLPGGGHHDPVEQAKKVDEKVVAAEMQKYAQLDEMAKEAQASAFQRIILKEDYDLSNMAKDRAAKIAQGNWTANLEKAYGQARVNRALITETQIDQVMKQADQKRLQEKRREQQLQLQEQRRFDSQMLGLQSNFNQLGQNAARVNIRSMTSELLSFAHAQVGFEKMTTDQKLSIMGGGFQAMAGLMSNHNRIMFDLGKAAAIGNAIVNVAEGVTKALALGPIEGPIMAGIIEGAGAIQIAAIANAKMGSTAAAGAATPSYGGSGAAPVVPVNPLTGIPTSTSTPTHTEHVYYLQLPADPNQGISRAQAKYVADMQAKDKQDGIVSRLVMTG